VAYPDGTVPGWSDFRSNWNVGASLSVPLFTGGRIRGDVLVARAGLDEAEARLRQTRELAALDTRTQLQRLETARAQWEASAGTVEQARRAYQIAEVRYDEGISTQVELADARILLQQAEANRASAARDYLVARARVELLPDLPFDLAGAAQAAAAAAQQQLQQQTTTTQQQTPQGGGADQTQGGFSGTGGA
jgi:outer membrane protein TolC